MLAERSQEEIERLARETARRMLTTPKPKKDPNKGGAPKGTAKSKSRRSKTTSPS